VWRCRAQSKATLAPPTDSAASDSNPGPPLPNRSVSSIEITTPIWGIREGQAPALFVLRDKETQLVNYRVKNDTYIIDRLIDSAAIDAFKPAPYYVVSATMQAQGGARFRALWSPGPAAEAHLDEEKRLLRRDIADAVRQRVLGQRGSVTLHTEDKRAVAPPLPYSLADLQMDAGKRLGLSAQAVLDACQALYETHRLATYPRSDCPHLPEGHWAQAKDVLAGVVKHAPSLAAAAAKADMTLRSKAWNDKKVTAHHAIVPTPSAAAPAAQLSVQERAVYEFVCRRYVAQFYGPHEYLQTKLELDVAGERFTATGRQLLAAGWKAFAADVPDDERAEGGDGDKPDADAAAPLPPLQTGDTVTASEAVVADKRTQPLKAFNDASLIAAMCAVGKFVKNPSVKKILTETDGIGTPATRAAIIETLFERGYVKRDKKSVVSTETGRALIHSLPEVATTPDMTAVWEAAMRAITDRAQSLDAFLGRVNAQLGQLVEQGRALGRIAVPSAACAPSPTSHRPARPSRVPSSRSKRGHRP
jgi:DNA topoisomerase III